MKRFFENNSDTVLLGIAIMGIIFILYLFVWAIGVTVASFDTASTVSPGRSSSGGFDIDGATKVLDARGVSK